ncbi:hypothetical protein BPUN_3637 [Candidatus Paraburkholderia kirkii]|nr:hypothetical protein BPUN_3637 [Candidatus Paraburkholderia kirkii]
MTTPLDPIVSEFATVEEAEAYDKWFREKVRRSMADTRPRWRARSGKSNRSASAAPRGASHFVPSYPAPALSCTDQALARPIMNAASASASLREVGDLPSPRGLPLLGNLYQLPPATHHLTLERWAAKLGTPYVFRFGTTPVTVWSDIELSHAVLRERPHRYRRYAPIERILKEFGCNGLFSIEGPAWEPQRRLVM